MTYASPDDVQTRLGRVLTTEETALVGKRLEDVERMIIRRVPDLADKISDEDVDEADVVQIEADAVLRLVRNPDGYASETDGNYSYQFSRDVASGRLEILPEEWAVLQDTTRHMSVLVPAFTASPDPDVPDVHPFYYGG